MQAIVYTQYGSPDVLQLSEVATPQPADGEVLVKVQATGLNAADRYALGGKPFIARLITGRLRRPKPVSYTHLPAHETVLDIACRLLL